MGENFKKTKITFETKMETKLEIFKLLNFYIKEFLHDICNETIDTSFKL